MDELIEALDEGARTTLREMAGVEAVATIETIAEDEPALAEVSMSLALTFGDGSRTVILSMPRDTAADLTRRVMGEHGTEPNDEMMRDCAGELLNVIAGQAKALLFGTPRHFTLATPVAIAEFPVPRTQQVSIGLHCEAGGLTLYV